MSADLPDPTLSRRAELRSEVVRILCRHSYSGLAPEAVEDRTPLLDGGLQLESIGLLDAIVDLEAAFQLQLREEELQDGALGTVGALVGHIAGKLYPPASVT